MIFAYCDACVVCNDTCVSLSASDDLDNRAFVCVCVCVCVRARARVLACQNLFPCNRVVYLSFVSPG